MKTKWKSKLKALNWKVIIITAIAIMLAITVLYSVKFFINNEDSVPFEVLSEKMIPQKIHEILPRYKNLERALACKVDDEIYIIATRGEKPSGGYSIEIDRIEKIKEDDRIKLIVYAIFEDPKPGDIVTQAITYEYTVVKTELKQLPDKIELKVKYDD